MTFKAKAAGVLVVIGMLAALVWAVLHYHDKYLDEQKRAETAEQDAKSASAITSNVLRVITITNKVTEANQHAKQQIVMESQSAQKDIRTAVAGDDCANRAVPVAAAKRLHEYADSLRNGSANSSASQPDS